jgi:hypothetical protein
MNSHSIIEIKMRKTSDLVQELREESKKAWLGAIAVGFEKETKFVFSSSQHPLEDLNKLVKIGGSPIGLLLFEKTGTTVEGAYRPFAEYENEVWAGNYLAGLLDNTENIIILSEYQQNLPDY